MPGRRCNDGGEAHFGHEPLDLPLLCWLSKVVRDAQPVVTQVSVLRLVVHAGRRGRRRPFLLLGPPPSVSVPGWAKVTSHGPLQTPWRPDQQQSGPHPVQVPAERRLEAAKLLSKLQLALVIARCIFRYCDYLPRLENFSRV